MSAGRVLGVWLLLAAARSANGIFRERALVALVGRRAADVASAASGIAIIIAIALRFLRPARRTERGGGVRVAGAWVTATVAFEFIVGRLVDRKSWRELFENYAIWRGRLWPFVFLSVAIAPVISLRRQLEDEPARDARTLISP